MNNSQNPENIEQNSKGNSVLEGLPKGFCFGGVSSSTPMIFKGKSMGNSSAPPSPAFMNPQLNAQRHFTIPPGRQISQLAPMRNMTFGGTPPPSSLNIHNDNFNRTKSIANQGPMALNFGSGLNQSRTFQPILNPFGTSNTQVDSNNGGFFDNMQIENSGRSNMDMSINAYEPPIINNSNMNTQGTNALSHSASNIQHSSPFQQSQFNQNQPSGGFLNQNKIMDSKPQNSMGDQNMKTFQQQENNTLKRHRFNQNRNDNQLDLPFNSIINNPSGSMMLFSTPNNESVVNPANSFLSMNKSMTTPGSFFSSPNNSSQNQNMRDVNSQTNNQFNTSTIQSGGSLLPQPIKPQSENVPGNNSQPGNAFSKNLFPTPNQNFNLFNEGISQSASTFVTLPPIQQGTSLLPSSREQATNNSTTPNTSMNLSANQGPGNSNLPENTSYSIQMNSNPEVKNGQTHSINYLNAFGNKPSVNNSGIPTQFNVNSTNNIVPKIGTDEKPSSTLFADQQTTMNSPLPLIMQLDQQKRITPSSSLDKNQSLTPINFTTAPRDPCSISAPANLDKPDVQNSKLKEIITIPSENTKTFENKTQTEDGTLKVSGENPPIPQMESCITPATPKIPEFKLPQKHIEEDTQDNTMKLANKNHAISELSDCNRSLQSPKNENTGSQEKSPKKEFHNESSATSGDIPKRPDGKNDSSEKSVDTTGTKEKPKSQKEIPAFEPIPYKPQMKTEGFTFSFMKANKDGAEASSGANSLFTKPEGTGIMFPKFGKEAAPTFNPQEGPKSLFSIPMEGFKPSPKPQEGPVSLFSKSEKGPDSPQPKLQEQPKFTFPKIEERTGPFFYNSGEPAPKSDQRNTDKAGDDSPPKQRVRGPGDLKEGKDNGVPAFNFSFGKSLSNAEKTGFFAGSKDSPTSVTKRKRGFADLEKEDIKDSPSSPINSEGSSKVIKKDEHVFPSYKSSESAKGVFDISYNKSNVKSRKRPMPEDDSPSFGSKIFAQDPINSAYSTDKTKPTHTPILKALDGELANNTSNISKSNNDDKLKTSVSKNEYSVDPKIDFKCKEISHETFRNAPQHIRKELCEVMFKMEVLNKSTVNLVLKNNSKTYVSDYTRSFIDYTSKMLVLRERLTELINMSRSSSSPCNGSSNKISS